MGPQPTAPVLQSTPSSIPFNNPLSTSESVENVRPSCGSKARKVDYDITIHAVGLLLVLLFSCFGAGFPVLAKKVKWLRIPPRAFFACKHFGTGVLIATAFVHLLPTAFRSLNNPCLPELFTEKYPALPGVIAMFSLFCLFTVELWMHTKMPHSHNHGSATGEEFSGTPLPARNLPPVRNEKTEPIQPPQSTEIPHALTHDEPVINRSRFSTSNASTHSTTSYASTDMLNKEARSSEAQKDTEEPRWFTSFRKQYEKQRESMLKRISRSTPRPISTEEDLERQTAVSNLVAAEQQESHSLGVVDYDPETVDPAIYKKMSMEITLIEGGILFHSIFVGMTVSITTEGFLILLIAILFHQTFEGLGLGSRIAAVPYPKGSWKPWLLVFAFGTTAPIGQAIGLATHNSYDPNSAFALILVGTFNAISSGLLIYAALVDLLQQDFFSEEADRLMSSRKKVQAFIYVLIGAAAMATVGAFA
ncbi:Zinc/iron permease [Microthyrium microscopicum]|uniref:Zinc/iron permease n=1 Tax=Microthyrium microscopicum TaxID=703497 RepID=A0A6A6TWR7_9PEZI|nr:Zinc/iron permease [Microthyrium microscopicum]